MVKARSRLHQGVHLASEQWKKTEFLDAVHMIKLICNTFAKKLINIKDQTVIDYCELA